MNKKVNIGFIGEPPGIGTKAMAVLNGGYISFMRVIENSDLVANYDFKEKVYVILKCRKVFVINGMPYRIDKGCIFSSEKAFRELLRHCVRICVQDTDLLPTDESIRIYYVPSVVYEYLERTTYEQRILDMETAIEKFDNQEG